MWEQTKGEIRDKREKMQKKPEHDDIIHSSFVMKVGVKKFWSQWIDCIHVFLINSLFKLHFSFSHLLVLETAWFEITPAFINWFTQS